MLSPSIQPPTLLPRALALLAALLVLLVIPVGSAQAAKLPKLVLAGPAGTVSYPLIHMVESGALQEVADQVELVFWRNPDQLRVLALEGRADFIAMPSNVAANLYNRGVELNLLNVSVWGVLWLVSRDPALQTLADFKSQEIAIPFRGDMPDIVFGLVAEGQGLDPQRDFTLRYVAGPPDAMQLLVAGVVNHALLSEPSASMALRRVPGLSRSVDLQSEWGRVFETAPRLPQAGIAVLGEARKDAALVARFQAAYAASLQWCQDHAAECGELVARRIDLLTAEAVADSIAVSQLRFVEAAEAQPELEAFFARLLLREPALVGGRWPDAGFYYPSAR
ncbi:MAG: ABC transporter substrate-binding protein [Truepera sp.]|nr:ABC transporter substrate-binding protein [Truepera sp.]